MRAKASLMAGRKLRGLKGISYKFSSAIRMLLLLLLLLLSFLGSLTFPATCSVDLRDGSAQTTVRAATLGQKFQIKLAISPSHSILTQGQPVTALTLQRQAAGQPLQYQFLSHWNDSTRKIPGAKRESNP